MKEFFIRHPFLALLGLGGICETIIVSVKMITKSDNIPSPIQLNIYRKDTMKGD